MMPQSEHPLCVCILAHNEQKHIARTIRAIRSSCDDVTFQIKVYANGCTDNTVSIVRHLSKMIPNVYLRELEEASKPKAWNAAFEENNNQVLIFADGDVEPQFGVVRALWQSMQLPQGNFFIVGCTSWPHKSGLSISQRLVGFLQIPLCQDFLDGKLYAVNRQALCKEFQKRGFYGIPAGVVAEDSFLQLIIPPEKFSIINERVFYYPPELRDYWKYLARVQWQGDQLRQEHAHLFSVPTALEEKWTSRLKRKFSVRQRLSRWALGLFATSMRTAVKVIFNRKIDRTYQELGAVSASGKNILNQATRSHSTK